MKYESDGLTINWYDSQPGVVASRRNVWWGENPKGLRGISYCIVNSVNPDRISKQISHLTTLPFEILTMSDDVEMPALLKFCKYNWVQRISDDQHKTDPNYNPKISIIMTTFKRQHCILRTVNWIRQQDYSNWELIIVNNEKDGPPLPALPDDPRISIYNPTEEANGCYSRNQGLKWATGDLICNFDDDDEMLPGFLRKMVAPFCDPDVKVVRCGMLTKGGCDFSYSTQEAWLRREHATATWQKGTAIHDQIYYHTIVNKNGWTRKNIVQLGEVLVIAHTEPIGGRRSVNAED